MVAIPLAALALPQDPAPTTPKKASVVNDKFSGTVTELSADSLTVVRSVPAKDAVTRKFALEPQTKVEGKLRVKARVTVQYLAEDEGSSAPSTSSSADCESTRQPGRCFFLPVFPRDIDGHFPRRILRTWDAPCRISNSMISMSPCPAAVCSGVPPADSPALGSAPCESRTAHKTESLFAVAECSGVTRNELREGSFAMPRAPQVNGEIPVPEKDRQPEGGKAIVRKRRRERPVGGKEVLRRIPVPQRAAS